MMCSALYSTHADTQIQQESTMLLPPVYWKNRVSWSACTIVSYLRVTQNLEIIVHQGLTSHSDRWGSYWFGVWSSQRNPGMTTSLFVCLYLGKYFPLGWKMPCTYELFFISKSRLKIWEATTVCLFGERGRTVIGFLSVLANTSDRAKIQQGGTKVVMHSKHKPPPRNS